MKILTIEKEISGEKMVFCNQRILFWEAHKAIILSDLHIGKAAHFRKSGIAISSGVLIDDLARLSVLINHFSAQKVVIVGDLLHAGLNSDLEIFRNWRERFSQDFVLVKGNHDRISADFQKNFNIEVTADEFVLEPFTFAHDPENFEPKKYFISGHIHPGILLKGKTENIKMPCFAFSDKQLILPAFSRFTGLDCRSLGNNFVKIAFSKELICEV